MARRAEPAAPLGELRRERIAVFRLGLSAEGRATRLLIAKSYRIAARHWKTPFGEIGIVARRRTALVFVEVKAREYADDAAEAVAERGKSRIAPAAELWARAPPQTMRGAISASTSCWSRPARCRDTSPIPSIRPAERRESTQRHGGRCRNCVEVGNLNPSAPADSCL
jgi:putative endonuclease